MTSEKCACYAVSNIRKDQFRDDRFSYAVCPTCRLLWCRIERCDRVFQFNHELMKHQMTCHRYPALRLLVCECNQPRAIRTDFLHNLEACAGSGCKKILCLYNGCDRVCKDQASHTMHFAQDHGNLFDCTGCGDVGVRIRETKHQSLQCARCKDTHWCLRGYCEWIGAAADLPVHLAACTFKVQ